MGLVVVGIGITVSVATVGVDMAEVVMAVGEVTITGVATTPVTMAVMVVMVELSHQQFLLLRHLR